MGNVPGLEIPLAAVGEWSPSELVPLTQEINPFLAFVDIVAVTGVGAVVTEPEFNVPRAKDCPGLPPLSAKLKLADTEAVTVICSLFVPVVIAVAQLTVSIGVFVASLVIKDPVKLLPAVPVFELAPIK